MEGEGGGRNDCYFCCSQKFSVLVSDLQYYSDYYFCISFRIIRITVLFRLPGTYCCVS